MIEFYTTAPLFLQIAMPIQAAIAIWAFWYTFKARKEMNKKDKKD